MICACSFSAWVSIIFSSWDCMSSVIGAAYPLVAAASQSSENMVLMCYFVLVPLVLFARVLKSIVLVVFILFD
jgi:hypothetical protein